MQNLRFFIYELILIKAKKSKFKDNLNHFKLWFLD